MIWSDRTAALQNWLEAAPVGGTPTADFTAALPVLVNNAELRIYRDIDFLAFRQTNALLKATAGNRVVDLLGMTFAYAGRELLNGVTTNFNAAYPNPVKVESIGAVTDSTAGVYTVVQYMPATLDFIDMVWPSQQKTGAPTTGNCWFTMLSDSLAVLAPTPDQAYYLAVTGMWRPLAMSSTNTETWRGDQLPDLFFASVMVEASGWLRAFGAQSDDPRLAVSWETLYQARKASAIDEERRRRGLPPAPPPPSMPAPQPGG